jgi:predicted amidohydrolase
LCSGSNVEENLDVAEALVHRAADEGATYIQLPEYFNYMGPSKNFHDVRETIPGATTSRMGALARSRNVTLHLGSMIEVAPNSSRCFNTSVVLGPSGDILALYRKTHLFDIDVPGRVAQRESAFIAPGDELVVTDVAGLRLGLSVCFDLRFPEMYRRLALSGADVFAIPSAFNAHTGDAHWDILVRARAIENLAFVVAAAQVGTTSEGVATFGHSLIVGPWGDVLAESLTPHEDVIVATIDPIEVTRRREQLAVLKLRRPDLYDVEPT